MNELTYGQLPVSPEHGVAMHCSSKIRHESSTEADDYITAEEGCFGSYSACRGDYFYMGADVSSSTVQGDGDGLPVVCSECEAPMVLLREVTTYEHLTAS